MSSESTPGEFGHEVLDEEGTVDQKVKARILQARQRVDDREDYLYVEAPVDNAKSIDELQQLVYWGVTVKQYLRAIEPILRADDVSKSDEYYKNKDLGSVTLVPQDTERYPFRKVAQGMIGEMEFKIQFNIPRGVELPVPTEQGFDGLKSVIEAGQTVSKQWEIKTGSYADPDKSGVITTRDEKPIPKHIYENAVRQGDAFLQQAGIGLEIGKREREVEAGPI